MGGPGRARRLRDAADGAVARLHEPAADVAVRRLGDVGELSAEMQVGSVDEAEGGHDETPVTSAGAPARPVPIARGRQILSGFGTMPSRRG